jgi:hypothetical protein
MTKVARNDRDDANLLRNIVEEEIVQIILNDKNRRQKFVDRITNPKSKLDDLDEKIILRILKSGQVPNIL